MKKYYDKCSSSNSYPSYTACNSTNTYTAISKKNYDLWSKSVSYKPDSSCNSSDYMDINDKCFSSSSTCYESDSCYENTNHSNNGICSEINNSCLEICDCNKLYNYKCGKDIINLYETPVSEFILESDDCEVRVDLSLKENKTIVLWGEVRDKCENTVENVIVTLLRPVYLRGNIEYVKECSTLTNCVGYYQFHLDYCNKDTCYKILLGNKC